MTEIADTIADRDSRYGGFANVAATDCRLMMVARDSPSYSRLSAAQAVALGMIVHKIARILNGDPNYADNWHDIAGYARLAEIEIEKAG